MAQWGAVEIRLKLFIWAMNASAAIGMNKLVIILINQYHGFGGSQGLWQRLLLIRLLNLFQTGRDC
jgi:hypothetical protein